MATALVQRLDYDKAEIRMAVHSPIEAKWRANACQKEPWTVKFIETMKRGDVLWDIGANVGSYSLIAAARGHRVVAIEPGLANFNGLMENGLLNRTPEQILALNVALGATTERIVWAQDSTPGMGEGGGIRLEIQQVTLDELVFGDNNLPAPTHLKIDVDGHELSVLAGARRTLEEGALRAVLVEVARKLGERVGDYLTGLGWTRMVVYDTRSGEPIKGIRYELFRKIRAKAEDGPDMGAGEPSSAIGEEAA